MTAIVPVDERVNLLNRGCQCITMDPEKLSTQLESLCEGSSERILGSMPNAFSTGPVFIGHEQVASILELIAAVDELGRNPAYRAEVLRDAPPAARVDTAAKSVFFGYDFHLSPDGPKLIEINTNAGGAMLNLALGRAQAACCPPVEPLMQAAHDDGGLEDAIVSMFRAEAKAGVRPELKRIAIVDEDPTEQFLYPELLLFSALFERHGIDTRIVDPGELRCDGTTLTHNGDSIDLVYNRLTDFYLESSASAALRSAWDNHAAVITPHPQAYALFADKRNLELLSNADRLREFGLSPAHIETLIKAVPTTQRVRPLDADDLWARRKQLFFKPATGFGSRAAYSGAKITKKVFAQVLEGDYVAQQLITPSERIVAVDGQPTSLKVDVRAYTYDAQVLSFSARVYRGQVTNMRTPGGGFAPLFVLPPIETDKAVCCT